MKRHVEVVRELLRAQSRAALEPVYGGQNAAHLCVMSSFIEGLTAVFEDRHNDEQLLASVDEDGNSLLHLSVPLKNLEVVEYITQLMADKEIKNAKNKQGRTALDLAESMPSDLEGLVTNFHINVGIQRSIQVNFTTDNGHIVGAPSTHGKRERIFRLLKKLAACMLRHDKKWVETMSGCLIIVSILVATVSFQAMMKPPSGVLAEDHLTKYNDSLIVDYPAGTPAAVASYFYEYNTYAFLSSLSVILLLVSGTPINHKICTWILVLLVWATLTFMTLAYANVFHLIKTR